MLNCHGARKDQAWDVTQHPNRYFRQDWGVAALYGVGIPGNLETRPGRSLPTHSRHDMKRRLPQKANAVGEFGWRRYAGWPTGAKGIQHTIRCPAQHRHRRKASLAKCRLDADELFGFYESGSRRQ